MFPMQCVEANISSETDLTGFQNQRMKELEERRVVVSPADGMGTNQRGRV